MKDRSYFNSAVAFGRKTRLRTVFCFSVLIFSFAGGSIRLSAQNSDAVTAFQRLAQELSANRLESGAEVETRQEQAMAALDSVAISALNASASPDLDIADQQLANFTAHAPRVGENCRLIKIADRPQAFALVVNLGQGGPAAVRIYVSKSGVYGLAARIDQFTQKGFFDSDIELVPVSIADGVFVVVAGRTDDLSTGIFSAWRFDGHAVMPLWTSELLQQSNYEIDGSGFRFSYCGEPDEDHPEHCLQMRRDLYRFQAGEWKRMETVDIPDATAPAK